MPVCIILLSGDVPLARVSCLVGRPHLPIETKTILILFLYGSSCLAGMISVRLEIPSSWYDSVRVNRNRQGSPPGLDEIDVSAHDMMINIYLAFDMGMVKPNKRD